MSALSLGDAQDKVQSVLDLMACAWLAAGGAPSGGMPDDDVRDAIQATLGEARAKLREVQHTLDALQQQRVPA